MRAAVLLLLVALPVLAAPVPKALKKKPMASPDGDWRLVQFSSNGAEPAAPKNMGFDWVVVGDTIYPGTRDELAKQKCFGPNFTVRDPEQPHLRMWGRNVSVYAVEGDTLRVCYATDGRKELTECKPDTGIAYYVLERVKEK